MKKIYLLLITVAITATGWSQATRTWVGPDNGSWVSAINWETGGVPGVIPQPGDIVVFSDGTTRTVINVPAITLGGLKIENSSTVTLQNTANANIVTIDDGPEAVDFKVDAGSSLILGNGVYPNGVSIFLKVDQPVKASIAGTLIINPGTAYEADFNNVYTAVTGIIENRGLVTGIPSRLQFLAGSTYIHAEDEGDIPDASWDPASTCKITGIIFDGPRFLHRPSGNFIWDCSNQQRPAKLAAAGMNVAGTFSVVNTGESRLEMDQANLTVGNFNLSGGTFKVASDIITIFGIDFPTGIDRTLNVTGNVSISGGNLLMSTGGTITTDVGALNVSGNFAQTGGTITETGNSRGRINFNGTVIQAFSKTPAAIISNEIDFVISNNAKVDFGTSVLNGSTGDFTLSSGGKIITANANGLSATGSIQIGRSFSNGADYEFRGASTGVFTTTGDQIRDLIINNTTTGQVTAAKDFVVTRELTLASGYLTTSAANTVIIDYTGNATTANGAFVNGRLTRRINSTALFTFPVGKADGGLRTMGVTPVNVNNKTFTAEFFRSTPPAGALAGSITRVSACEYWDLNQDLGTNSPVRVTLSWASGSACTPGGYVTIPADLRVAHLVGGTWDNEGGTGPTGNALAGTITSNPINNFSPFALASSSAANPLPVVFADVKAYEKNTGVQIEWSNLTEKDVAEYTIERSANGRDFSAIGKQLPTSNQNDKASYDAFDAAPNTGANYYRIKAEETTGKIVYSKILSVNLGKTNQGLKLYPNPVSGNQVTVSLSNVKRGQYNLRVVNTVGQDIFKQTINNQSTGLTQTIDLPSSVKPGVYNLIVTGDNYRESKMFIVQ